MIHCVPCSEQLAAHQMCSNFTSNFRQLLWCYSLANRLLFRQNVQHCKALIRNCTKSQHASCRPICAHFRSAGIAVDLNLIVFWGDDLSQMKTHIQYSSLYFDHIYIKNIFPYNIHVIRLCCGRWKLLNQKYIQFELIKLITTFTNFGSENAHTDFDWLLLIWFIFGKRRLAITLQSKFNYG